MFSGNDSSDDAMKAAIFKRTIEILTKTNPDMARAMLLEYRKSAEGGMDGLGALDLGSIISNAANSLVSVGVQYAGAKAQNKLNMQAADNAARLATKDIENSVKQQKILNSYAVSQQTLKDAEKYRTSMAESAKESLSDTPKGLWVALAGLSAALGFSIWNRSQSATRKRK